MTTSEEKSTHETKVVPIAIEKSFLEGKGLTAGDPSEFDDEGVTSEKPDEVLTKFSTHNFFAGKIAVSVYESDPAKVRIDGLPYDEYVHILEGRLILSLDDGETFEFKQGESLIVPQGFTGYWHMPEKYRELIIINTDYS